MYDGVLDLRVPKEVTLIGFADDLSGVVVELYASETIHAIKAWFQMVKLDLAEDKAETVLKTRSFKSISRCLGAKF